MLETGQVIGCYRILRKLGEGGMGAVFEASHDEIARRAAIKVLHPQFAQDPQVAQRFLNEAKAVNQIDHPGIVSIYDVGRLSDGTSYIIMEFLKGETLTARADRRGGRLSVAEALHVLRQVASALTAAHQSGIVHRDLKPDNIMIIRDPLQSSGERIKVLDFGIARLGAEAGGGGGGAGGPRLTRTGSVMGTPIYMSPEQCRGAGRVDGKADVYSLGIILFQLLVGRPPFLAEGMGALMAMHIYESPPALADCLGDSPHVRILEPILAGLLAKEPHDRPAMAQVLQLLEPLVAASPFVRSAVPSEPPPELLRQGTPSLMTVHSRRSTLGGAALGRSDHSLRDRGRRSWATWLGGGLFILGANVGIWQILQRVPSHTGTVESVANQYSAAVDTHVPPAGRPIPPALAGRPLAMPERVLPETRSPDAAASEVRPTAAKKPKPALKRANGPPRRTGKDEGKARVNKGASSASPEAPSSPAKNASPARDDPPETPDF